MFKITIKTGEQGRPPVILVTESRALARSCYLLCEENNLECEVVVEVKPRLVKFKGV